jgi:transcription initiation factor TFIID subunit 9B
MTEIDSTRKHSPSRLPDSTTIHDAPAGNLTAVSLASNADTGLSKRPRDTRLVHIFLANLGVTAYQERVPLQLMDFAYRYTSSTLQDALHLTSEGYGSSASFLPTGRGSAPANHPDMSSVTLSALRLSIASRTHYQFNPNLPKEFYQEIAQERNRVALPAVDRDWGLRLPPEQYCLTGEGWNLKDEWDTEGDEKPEGFNAGQISFDDPLEYGEDSEGEDGNARMEDVFGEEFHDSEKNGISG